MAKISEFSTTAPYEAEYIEVNDILGKPIKILGVTVFSNNKGPGAYALIELDGKQYRICTHGVVVVDSLGRAEVLKALEAGEVIECKFVKVPSKTNNGREVLKLEDP